MQFSNLSFTIHKKQYIECQTGVTAEKVIQQLTMNFMQLDYTYLLLLWRSQPEKEPVKYIKGKKLTGGLKIKNDRTFVESNYYNNYELRFNLHKLTIHNFVIIYNSAYVQFPGLL